MILISDSLGGVAIDPAVPPHTAFTIVGGDWEISYDRLGLGLPIDWVELGCHQTMSIDWVELGCHQTMPIDWVELGCHQTMPIDWVELGCHQTMPIDWDC